MKLNLLSILTIAFASAVSFQARAEYPDKPIRLVVGNPAGGGADLVARFLGAEITQRTGQPVLVDNRAGAGGSIAAQHVMKAAPDGYTLMLATSNSHMINPAVIKNLPYHPTKDFVPITMVGTTPNLLVVHPSFPASSLAELIALAKAKPGQYSFGSNSPGGSSHMSGELLKHEARIDLVHVPYKGGGPMLVDLVSNHIPLAFETLPSAMSFVKAGRLKAIAVTSRTRWPSTPEIPTMSEAGLPGFDVSAWYGVVAPAGVSKPVVDKLSSILVGILKDPRVAQKMLELGVEPGANTVEEFGSYINERVAYWIRVTDQAGIKVD